MSNTKAKIKNRLVAGLLSLIMVFTMLPFSEDVQAASEEYPDCVTVTVTDEKGQAVEGASVEFSVDSKTRGEDYISDVAETDKNGIVKLMDSAGFVPEDLTFSATVTAEGYKKEVIEDKVIKSADENFEIKLISTVISGITVEPVSLKYDGYPHDAVVIKGVQQSDKVSYKLNEEAPVNEMPQITELGVYNVTVIVEREGFDPLEKTVVSEITPNTIELTVTEYSAPYDGKDHPALTIEGIKMGDSVTYCLNDGERQSDIPRISDVGNYKVNVRVERYGYESFDRDFTNISITALEIEGLSAEAYTGTYDGREHPAVTVSGTQEGDKIEYKLGEGEWTTTVPMIEDAGTYAVKVRVSRENYSTTDVQVLPANAFIEKKEQFIQFNNYTANDTKIVEISQNESENTYDFSAIAGEETTNPLVYSVVNASDDGKDISKIASIDSATGTLVVKSAGCITVEASKNGNKNYADSSVAFNLVITEKGEVSFAYENIEYIIGENGGIVSDQEAIKKFDDDNGALTYLIEGDADKYGLIINAATGEIKVEDYNKLSKAIQSEKDECLSVSVKAEKSPGIKMNGNGRQEVYSEAEAAYKVDIFFMDMPESQAYTIAPESPESQYGWYDTAVTVTPAAEYTVAKEEVPATGEFSNEIKFDDQGSNTRYIYLRDVVSGGITNKIPVNIKIDTQIPDAAKMHIEIPELSLVDKIGSKFGFFEPSVNIKFVVEDETEEDESGIEYVEWFYIKDENASSSILAEKTGRLPVVLENGAYIATLTLTANEFEQFRGHVSFIAYDKAGNCSEEVRSIEYEDGKYINDAVIVVDTISPELVSADFKLADQENGKYTAEMEDGVRHHYFNGAVDFTFTIREANFFAEDVEINVTKDGTPWEVETAWTVQSSDDEIHFGNFVLDQDGDYVVTMSYKDPTDSEQEAIGYTSEVITVDTEAPVLNFRFDEETQKASFSVNEKYFNSEDISIEGEITDITGKAVDNFSAEKFTELLQEAEWTREEENENRYTYETDFKIGGAYINGIYDLSIKYKDTSGNEANTIEPEVFVVDHEKPYDIKIEYDEETSIGETILEVLTLGFYKPDVKVTFTAYDTDSGIDYFSWNYERWDYTEEDGKSTIIRPTDTAEQLKSQVIQARQDAEDKSKFTGQITLPQKEAEQLRGYLSVIATDRCGNLSDKYSDNENILIVDTISPTIAVEYSQADNIVGNTAYYKGDAIVKFDITEENFFEDDVLVSVSKDGAAPVRVQPDWQESDAVEADGQTQIHHIGTYVISGDGDYEVFVTYTDKSQNEMEAYTSHVITIDTTAPVIDVVYSNTDPVNTLKDREGHSRDYFAETQTAEISVTEHNFDESGVAIDITAKDAAGNEIDADSLHMKSKWSSAGDVHTMTVTYPGDANYIFDISCVDLATNKSADYMADYFTVDKTGPENLKISYSQSVLDTVLGALTFGFYNSKVKVTISAEDEISGVNSFLYSYIKAEGVSRVNAELKNQMVTETAGNISYSEGGKKATATFEIPRNVLSRNNQFNGNVEFTTTDRSGNESGRHRDSQRIVVDNIAPTAQISYNEATNIVDGISYYSGNINASITVNEANFYAEDVQVTVAKDGGESIAVTPSWSSGNTDVHVGTFTLSEDGDYIVNVNYSDKSSNRMATYTSGQMTIDTEIEEPVFSINGIPVAGNGGAYKNDALVAFKYEDKNFASETITLTKTRFDSVENVTEEFIAISQNDQGGEGNFTIPATVENDGIYTLDISMTDKANHTVASQIRFSINRYGSVYVYDDYLMSLIKDGGQYITIKKGNDAAVTEDLVITEYNADKILEDSLNILITRDGEAINSDYTVDPVNINTQSSEGVSGWYQYEYRIKATNFAEDGVYRIAISSAYAATDSERNESTSVPENSIDENGNQVLDSMSFTVDTAAPEIRNIVNMDKAIVNAQKLDVDYTIVDVGGLQSIEIILNGDTVDKITQFNNDAFNYAGQFTINESSGPQTVRIKATDRAGNITDTASKDFSTGGLYTFNDSIVVSTNFFVRWFANKPLFWGTIAGVIVVAGGICFFIVTKRKRKDQEQK